MNDGIIWKHSSQYSGLMSIYLRGYAHPFRFISASTYGALLQAPPTGTSVFQRMPAVYLYSLLYLLYDYAVLEENRPLVRIGEIFLALLVKVHDTVLFPLCVCVFQSQRHKQYMVSVENVWNLPNHWLPSPLSFRPQELLLSLRELLHFIHLSVLLPRHLMWQPILRGALIAVTPMGVKDTHLCGSRQLSLRII